MNQTISNIIRGAAVVGPQDSLRRAANLIQASDGSSLVVISDGRIIGTISGQAIASALAQAADPDQALAAPVGQYLEPGLVFVNFGATMREAASTFASSGLDTLPVIDDYGGYHGVIHRSDLIGFVTRSMKLPPVAGMATPLGVYLTTGSVAGGAGSLGLFLTGMSLALMIVLAQVISVGGLHWLGRFTGIPIAKYLASPPIGVLNVLDIPFYVSMALQLLVFAVLMRLSPLSGYHAAEHMTVHAIEAGEELTEDNVRRMPRVHPRCGTNLLAGASLFMIVSSGMGSDVAILAGLVVVMLGWRTVGGWMQQFITTRPPSRSELANGVAAGKQLVEKFHDQPNYVVSGWTRVWRMGLLQTAAGMGLVLTVASQLARLWHIPWLNL